MKKSPKRKSIIIHKKNKNIYLPDSSLFANFSLRIPSGLSCGVWVISDCLLIVELDTFTPQSAEIYETLFIELLAALTITPWSLWDNFLFRPSVLFLPLLFLAKFLTTLSERLSFYRSLENLAHFPKKLQFFSTSVRYVPLGILF